MKLVKHKKLLAIRTKRNRNRRYIRLQNSISTSRRSIIRARLKAELKKAS